MGKANWWWPKTHWLEGLGSSHHLGGLNFCPRFHRKCSFAPLIAITCSNWVWLIFPSPAAHHLSYNPLMLLQHLSVWHPIPELLAFPFSAMYSCLQLAGGLICHSNISNISTFKLYSLWCIHVSDTYQTSWFLFVWNQKVFLLWQWQLQFQKHKRESTAWTWWNALCT